MTSVRGALTGHRRRDPEGGKYAEHTKTNSQSPVHYPITGKIFLSAGDKQLAIIAHVPKALAESKGVAIKEWVDALTAPLPTPTVVSSDEELVKLVIPADAEKGQFPLKMRDEAINAGFAFLRQKGLIPADDSSDDDVNYAEAAGVEW